MKILYIGTYREYSDAALDCENRIRFLATEHEVVARNVSNGPFREVHSTVEVAELGVLDNDFDLVIQDTKGGGQKFSNPKFKTLYIKGTCEYFDTDWYITNVFAEDYLKPPSQPLEIPQTEGTLRVISIVDGVSNDLYEGVKLFYKSFRPYEKATHTIFTKNEEGIDELCQRVRREMGTLSRPPEVIVPIPPERFIFPEIAWYGHVPNVIDGSNSRKLVNLLLEANNPEWDKLRNYNFDLIKADIEKSKRIHSFAKRQKEEFFPKRMKKFIEHIEGNNEQ